MAEDALERAQQRSIAGAGPRGGPERNAPGGDGTARAKGVLWLLVAYVLAGVVGAAVGALAWSVSSTLALFVGALAGALVLFGFDAFHRTIRFVELLFSVGTLTVAISVFRFAPHDGASAVRRVLVLGVVLVWAVRHIVVWVARFQARLRVPAASFDHPSSLESDLRVRYGATFWAVSLGALHLAPAVVLFLVDLSFLATFSAGRSGLNIVDIAASGVTLVGLVLAGVADAQLSRFLRTTRVPTRVCDEGLFSLCRHPRALGEMMFWWGMALFALSAHATAWWTILGPLAMSLVIVFYVAPRRDRRELARRPDYASYMRRVPSFLPKVLSS